MKFLDMYDWNFQLQFVAELYRNLLTIIVVCIGPPTNAQLLR